MKFTKLQIISDKRSYWEIDNNTDYYFAKLAWDSYGMEIRDNSLTEWISLGKEIE